MNDVHVLFFFIFRHPFLQESLRISLDDRQRRAQIVRDIRDDALPFLIDVVFFCIRRVQSVHQFIEVGSDRTELDRQIFLLDGGSDPFAVGCDGFVKRLQIPQRHTPHPERLQDDDRPCQQEEQQIQEIAYPLRFSRLLLINVFQVILCVNHRTELPVVVFIFIFIEFSGGVGIVHHLDLLPGHFLSVLQQITADDLIIGIKFHTAQIVVLTVFIIEPVFRDVIPRFAVLFRLRDIPVRVIIVLADENSILEMIPLRHRLIGGIQLIPVLIKNNKIQFLMRFPDRCKIILEQGGKITGVQIVIIQ